MGLSDSMSGRRAWSHDTMSDSSSCDLLNIENVLVRNSVLL